MQHCNDAVANLVATRYTLLLLDSTSYTFLLRTSIMTIVKYKLNSRKYYLILNSPPGINSCNYTIQLCLRAIHIAIVIQGKQFVIPFDSRSYSWVQQTYSKLCVSMLCSSACRVSWRYLQAIKDVK